MGIPLFFPKENHHPKSGTKQGGVKLKGGLNSRNSIDSEMRFIKGNRLQKGKFSGNFAPQAPILGFLGYNPEFPEN